MSKLLKELTYLDWQISLKKTTILKEKITTWIIKKSKTRSYDLYYVKPKTEWIGLLKKKPVAPGIRHEVKVIEKNFTKSNYVRHIRLDHDKEIIYTKLNSNYRVDRVIDGPRSGAQISVLVPPPGEFDIEQIKYTKFDMGHHRLFVEYNYNYYSLKSLTNALSEYISLVSDEFTKIRLGGTSMPAFSRIHYSILNKLMWDVGSKNYNLENNIYYNGYEESLSLVGTEIDLFDLISGYVTSLATNSDIKDVINAIDFKYGIPHRVLAPLYGGSQIVYDTQTKRYNWYTDFPATSAKRFRIKSHINMNKSLDLVKIKNTERRYSVNTNINGKA